VIDQRNLDDIYPAFSFVFRFLSLFLSFSFLLSLLAFSFSFLFPFLLIANNKKTRRGKGELRRLGRVERSKARLVLGPPPPNKNRESDNGDEKQPNQGSQDNNNGD